MTKTINSIALSSSARTFYEANSVTDDVKSLLEETAVFLIGVTRRSTEEAFELGERLERAAALLPEGTLEKWAVERCGYTARHVRTQRAVFRNLARYKDILVELAVGPTVLGKLSTAEPEQIEQAIGFAAQNGKLRVLDVTGIMTGSKNEVDPKPHVDPYDVGDIDGLKAIIAFKVRDGIRSFIGHLQEIREHVEAALKQKNIVKKALAEQIVHTSRLARRELESLAQFVRPNPDDAAVVWSTQLPAKTRWSDVGDLLYKMGNIESWPEKGKLRTWLETEVVPTLEWVTPKPSALPIPGAETNEAPSVNVQTEVAAAESVPSVISDDPARADTASVEERLKTIAAAFGAEATVELPAASSQILPDDSIPSLTEALAEPPKAFKRPALLDRLDRIKAAANKPDDGAAPAA